VRRSERKENKKVRKIVFSCLVGGKRKKKRKLGKSDGKIILAFSIFSLL